VTDFTSLQNPRIKHVVRLREKRQREQEGLMLVEGIYELELALASGVQPREVFYCPEINREVPAAFDRLEPLTVTRSVFRKISYRDNPDGWLAVMSIPIRTLESLARSALPIVLLAESVEKPGNLGAILRTADAAGVDALLVCNPRTDLYNPNVVRASRGTLFSVSAVTTSNVEALRWLRAGNIRILAATPSAQLAYTEVDLCQPICIAVGTEDTGLTDFWMESADMEVKIPMVGKVNSLNVSTSIAIITYEVLRQRRVKNLVNFK
jgi:TrmH family RNA methyltransferase